MRAALIVAVLAGAATHADAKGCHETSSVVGAQRCSRFGDGWDVTNTVPIDVEVGFQVSRLSLSKMPQTGNVVMADRSMPFVVPGGALADTWLTSLSIRVLVFPARRIFYFGPEWEFGYAPVSAATGSAQSQALATSISSSLVRPGDGAYAASFGTVAGVAVPLWHLDLRAEVFIGVRASTVDFDLTAPQALPAPQCWTGAKGASICPYPASDFNFTARITPRVGLSARITPWITAGATVGFEALDGGAINLGAFVQFHNRAYDGFYKRKSPTHAE